MRNHSEESLSSAFERRELALERLRRASAGQSRPKVGCKPAAKRKSRGRTRKLSWLEERHVATFIELRRLDGRYVKNAVTDARCKFNVSRATVFRIMKRHGAGARFTARVTRRSRKRVFRKIIRTKKQVQLADFSDWERGPN